MKTPQEYLEIVDKDLIDKLQKNLLRARVTKVMMDFAKQYHQEQLTLSGVVSTSCDCEIPNIDSKLICNKCDKDFR